MVVNNNNVTISYDESGIKTVTASSVIATNRAVVFLFDSIINLPYSTDVTVTIPSGTLSSYNNKVFSGTSYTFNTET